MINETVAHYRILRKLGSGGVGVVYEAEDTKLGRRVALKFIPEENQKDAQTLERFLREARAASSLSHSGICTIHAIEEHDSRTFVAMELLVGQSLDQMLALGAVPVKRTIEIGIQLADALDAAHKKGIIHRDIKPANILSPSLAPSKFWTSASPSSSRAKMMSLPAARLTPRLLRPPRSLAQAWPSARFSTCPRSKLAARKSTLAATSSPSAPSSIKC